MLHYDFDKMLRERFNPGMFDSPEEGSRRGDFRRYFAALGVMLVVRGPVSESDRAAALRVVYGEFIELSAAASRYDDDRRACRTELLGTSMVGWYDAFYKEVLMNIVSAACALCGVAKIVSLALKKLSGSADAGCKAFAALDYGGGMYTADPLDPKADGMDAGPFVGSPVRRAMESGGTFGGEIGDRVLAEALALSRTRSDAGRNFAISETVAKNFPEGYSELKAFKRRGKWLVAHASDTRAEAIVERNATRLKIKER